MQLNSTKNVPAPVEQTYAALTDAQFLKDCIPGCESIEAAPDGKYLVTLAARVGPVSARFNGSMQILDPQPPRSYTLVFEGKGGPAGFAKGSAVVELVPADAGTDMTYRVKADVGGKIAQVGSRLIESAARKVADEFFDAFIAKMSAQMAPATSAAAQATVTGEAAGHGPQTAWNMAIISAVILLVAWVVWNMH
jgi:uncharacterized protein